MLLRRHVALTVLSAAVLGGGCGKTDGLTSSGSLAIRRFVVVPAQIVVGGTATLSWDTDGADSVAIDGGIGTVGEEGTRSLRPTETTRYTMTVKKGTSVQTATVELVVTAAPVPSPSPLPSPSPSPSASPSPSPSPTSACGPRAATPFGCGLTVELPSALAAGQCVELTSVTFNQACPVALGTTRTLGFEVTARGGRPLTWRRHASSTDVLTPSSGTLTGEGRSSIVVTDVVNDRNLTIEVLDGTTVVMAFTVRHY